MVETQKRGFFTVCLRQRSENIVLLHPVVNRLSAKPSTTYSIDQELHLIAHSNGSSTLTAVGCMFTSLLFSFHFEPALFDRYCTTTSPVMFPFTPMTTSFPTTLPCHPLFGAKNLVEYGLRLSISHAVHYNVGNTALQLFVDGPVQRLDHLGKRPPPITTASVLGQVFNTPREGVALVALQGVERDDNVTPYRWSKGEECRWCMKYLFRHGSHQVR